MKAIIIATGTLHTSDENAVPCELLPLVDKPLVQHIVENLVANGADELHFLLDQCPERFESLLGNGQRWGARFHFHLGHSSTTPYEKIGLIPANDDEPVLLVFANTLANLTPDQYQTTDDLSNQLFYYRKNEEESVQWSGWAWTAGSDLRAVGRCANRREVEHALHKLPGAQYAALHSTPIHINNLADLIPAQRTILSGSNHIPALSGRQIEPGIWVGRNAYIAADAQLTPPLYIGANTRINSGAILSSNSVVSQDCVIDSETHVEDALIMPGTYVGTMLELRRSVVEKSRITHIDLATPVVVADDFILGDLQVGYWQSACSALIRRSAAAFLLLAGMPFLLATCAVRKWKFRKDIWKKRIISVPNRHSGREKTFALWSLDTEEPSHSRRHLVHQFMPALWNVARGHMRFVGLPPRTDEELCALPHDWRQLYSDAHLGILPIDSSSTHDATTDGDRFAVESFAALNTSLRNDLRSLAAYLHSHFGFSSRAIKTGI